MVYKIKLDNITVNLVIEYLKTTDSRNMRSSKTIRRDSGVTRPILLTKIEIDIL